MNATLFEAVLGASLARGSARLLLAALAAIADEDGVVDRVTTLELLAAAGLADSTYRRARTVLLAAGELTVTDGGGRGNTNRWQVTPPARAAAPPPHRVPPPRGAVPLLAQSTPKTLPEHEPAASARVANGAPDRTVRPKKRPIPTGVSEETTAQTRTVAAQKGPVLTGVSRTNTAQTRTVSAPCEPETPSQTPPDTPPPNARAGAEPTNPRTGPPSPPEGGSRIDSITVVEDYVTGRGRKRQRTVTVQLDAARERFRRPDEVDVADWQRIRAELGRIAGEATFAIWLSALQLTAADHAGSLLVACPAATRGWVGSRFGRLLESAARSAGRELRLATEQEIQLLGGLADATRPPLLTNPIRHHHQEAI